MEDKDEDFAFNAMVKEDEMIITINEYKEMKSRIEWQDDCISNKRQEFEKLKIELEKVTNENLKLKNGIINIIKSLGGNHG